MSNGQSISRAGLLVLLALLSGCQGPRPEVADVKLTPPAAPGAPYLIDAAIRNGGGGEGEVSLVIRLVDSSTSTIYSNEGSLNLKARETARTVVRIFAPTGNYVPEVEAKYPPD